MNSVNYFKQEIKSQTKSLNYHGPKHHLKETQIKDIQ